MRGFKNAGQRVSALRELAHFCASWGVHLLEPDGAPSRYLWDAALGAANGATVSPGVESMSKLMLDVWSAGAGHCKVSELDNIDSTVREHIGTLITALAAGPTHVQMWIDLRSSARVQRHNNSRSK